MNEQPTLRVISGNPSAEDLAAIVAIVSSRSVQVEPEPIRFEWNNPQHLVRTPHHFGPGVWAGSARGTR